MIWQIILGINETKSNRVFDLKLAQNAQIIKINHKYKYIKYL